MCFPQYPIQSEASVISQLIVILNECPPCLLDVYVNPTLFKICLMTFGVMVLGFHFSSDFSLLDKPSSKKIILLIIALITVNLSIN